MITITFGQVKSNYLLEMFVEIFCCKKTEVLECHRPEIEALARIVYIWEEEWGEEGGEEGGGEGGGGGKGGKGGKGGEGGGEGGITIPSRKSVTLLIAANTVGAQPTIWYNLQT